MNALGVRHSFGSVIELGIHHTHQKKCRGQSGNCNMHSDELKPVRAQRASIAHHCKLQGTSGRTIPTLPEKSRHQLSQYFAHINKNHT